MNVIPTREEFYSALEQKHGKDIQQKFVEAKVAICGLGGLGSNIAIALARAGVGKLHLIDFDKVEISNLNRQQYNISQIGMDKTQALKENLQKIAPYVEIVVNTVRITQENIAELFTDEQIICEAFDRPEAKAMLVDGVLENFPNKYLVAGSGMAGLDSANEIKTKRITKRFFLCGDLTSDVDSGLGLYGARVLACAAHQATAILRIIAGKE
ncbi:MAG: sulfur carrier protein ThiS adenylyltransferase ThiF [Clostridia bacterium]|nr:sulfur carrier protein ThiS adenylyltransferase ThiF [Clostridia bacterium]MDE7328811.1 sulfur carrier protein ThiS adenylyltransferase ThiF [Clostridia bacterium]